MSDFSLTCDGLRSLREQTPVFLACSTCSSIELSEFPILPVSLTRRPGIPTSQRQSMVFKVCSCLCMGVHTFTISSHVLIFWCYLYFLLPSYFVLLSSYPPPPPFPIGRPDFHGQGSGRAAHRASHRQTGSAGGSSGSSRPSPHHHCCHGIQRSLCQPSHQTTAG